MSEEGKGNTPGLGQISPHDREAIRQRSEGIGRRLDEMNSRRSAAQPQRNAQGAAYGQAFKIAAELVVGLAFGGGVGWFLDRYFGTMPVMLIVFVLLGFAAGLLNVIRTARRAQAAAEPLQRASPSIADDDES